MRAYGQIQCSFWTDPDIQGLSDQARSLACYLLTGPHSNGLGCYRLPDGYIQADFGWTPQTVSKAFAELFQIGFCDRCETTSFVLIPKFMKWNPTSNPKIASAREKEFNAVPTKCSVYQQLAQCMVDHGLHWSEPFANRIETISKQEQERKGTERNKKGTEPDSVSGKPDGDTPNWTAQAREVFSYWQQVMEHPQAKFNPDDDRIKKVIQQIKSGYSVDDLKQAVDGCAKTPHNMGDNERGQRYDGLNVICKNGDNVDRFIRAASGPGTGGMSSAGRKTAAAAREFLND